MMVSYTLCCCSTCPNKGLAPGESFNWGISGPLTIPAQTVSGDYYIGSLVDSSNSVSESNEGNNYVSTPITISAAGKPDLVITSGPPTVTPSSVAPGETVELSAWTVKNQGTVNSGTFYNGYYLSTNATITSSDKFLTGNSSSSLAPGASFNLSLIHI